MIMQKSISIDRRTLDISKDSLLWRWYMYWVKLGGEKPDYKENLCHFVRVLCFWAPLRWFFMAHAKHAKVVSPWSITLFALLDIGFLVVPDTFFLVLFAIAQGL